MLINFVMRHSVGKQRLAKQSGQARWGEKVRKAEGRLGLESNSTRVSD